MSHPAGSRQTHHHQPSPVSDRWQDIAAVLQQCADAASDRAMRSYGHIDVRQASLKGRGDLVSQVDCEVESLIADIIRQHYPDHQILGEEQLSAGGVAVQPGPSWIIDPIDGTTNYLRQIPAWAVSIAFCPDAQSPAAAIVACPALDEVFEAQQGLGASCNGAPMSTTGCEELSQALCAGALPFRHLDALVDAVQVQHTLHTQVDDHRRCGAAAVDCAWVAAGRLDAYYELGIYPWDTAAGELLVREAGGVASDFFGHSGNILSRRSICVSASASLHQHILNATTPLRRWLSHEIYTPVAGALAP